jgi:hypothetical protein
MSKSLLAWERSHACKHYEIHRVQIKIGIFDFTKSPLLKTTHFAAGFSDDSTPESHL